MAVEVELVFEVLDTVLLDGDDRAVCQLRLHWRRERVVDYIVHAGGDGRRDSGKIYNIKEGGKWVMVNEI